MHVNKFAGFGGGIALAMALVWTPAAQVQGGRISGVVVADGGPEHGEPLAGVAVALRRGAQVQNTATDERGEFAFSNLAPGRYRINVNKSDYGGLELGAFRTGEEGTPVELNGPRISAHVMAQLPYPATISGVVLNAEGQPAVDVEIVARSPALIHPDLTFGTSNRTDLRGRFEVVVRRGETTITAIDTNRQRLLRTVTHYPGTADPARAERLMIRAGDDRELPPMKLVAADARIAGSVTLPDGQPAAGAWVTVQNAWDKIITTTSDAQGRFETAVAAGKYDLVAKHDGRPPSQPERMFDTSSVPALWARTAIEAASGQSARATLALKPLAALSGRVRTDRQQAPIADLGVVIKVDGLTRTLARTVDDRFDFNQIVPGDYGLALEGGPESPWWLKSATVNGRSLLAGPIVFEPGQRVTNAVLTLSRDRGELSGLLTGKNGLPQTEYWIALVPVDDSVRQTESPQVLRTRPATNGRFLFEGLPAGEYALSVFGDLGPGEWRKPENMTSLVAAGIKVRVLPDTPVVQNVRVER